MPFKMHTFFSEKKFIKTKYVYLPYLKFSDLLNETHLYFYSARSLADCMRTQLTKKRKGLWFIPFFYSIQTGGAQWLSGRVLDLRPKGRGFEPHRSHCVVVLEQDTFILA